MTFARIIAGVESCIENGEGIDNIVVTEQFMDEISDDDAYQTTPSADTSEGNEADVAGYSVIVGEDNYVSSKSGNKYEIPNNV